MTHSTLSRLAEGLEIEAERAPFLVLEGLAVYAAQSNNETS